MVTVKSRILDDHQIRRLSSRLWFGITIVGVGIACPASDCWLSLPSIMLMTGVRNRDAIESSCSGNECEMMVVRECFRCKRNHADRQALFTQFSMALSDSKLEVCITRRLH